MKRLLLFTLLFICCHVFSQDITGIWRGYFYANVGPYKDYYKYEVQIDQLKNNSLKGVTYSYRTTVFYGKATFEGIWFPKAKSLLVKELRLVDLKIADNSQACAMTCNLDYTVDGKTETMKGTFSSVNTTTNRDCGSGTVYLERVQESDFHKEDFLLRKNPDTLASSAPAKPKLSSFKKDSASAKKPGVVDVSKINAKKLQAVLGTTQDGIIGPKTLSQLKSKAPSFNEKLDLNNTNQVNRLVSIIKQNNNAAKQMKPATPVTKPTPQLPTIKNDTIVKSTAPVAPPEINNMPQKKIIPVPDVIKSRSNPLVKTITTNTQDVKIELYDNGEIDGDTITVYDNNQVIAWKKGLTDKPITLNIKTDANTPTHEFVMVADNLGSIPPNTALMIITTGGKRYQLFISSDKQKNAKVIVQYNANE